MNINKRLGDNPVGQGMGAGRYTGVNDTHKPRVKFYNDGCLYYQSGNYQNPSVNEAFGVQWFMDWMNTTKYYAWCRL